MGARAALSVAVLVALAAWLAGCGEESPRPPGPNLLLITVDTLRADALACYGGEPETGRAICALADNGTRFRWAFAPAPYTAPSIASMLTSRYPTRHGVTQSVLSFLANEAVSVAEVFADAGYTTAAFVSNPVLDRARNLGQGFQVWDQQMTRPERNRKRFAEREAEAATNATLAWARVAAKPPWFIWVHFQDPHGPYEPPDTPRPLDAAGEPRLAPLDDQSGRGGIPAYQLLPGIRTASAYTEAYRDEIRYLDPHVERLVAGLDALGEPPGILLSSDHGEALGEDDVYFAHGHSVALDQIRVPLLWRPPRPGTHRVVDDPVSLLDVAPTLLQLAQLEVPAAFAGRPLPLDGTGVDPDRPIFSEHAQRAAVVVGRAYFAHTHSSPEPGERDPVSGGLIVELPARSARLGPDGATPAYEADSGDGPGSLLAPLLVEHMRSARSPSKASPDTVSDEQRERLRALGYLD